MKSKWTALLLALALAFYCLWRAQTRGDTHTAAKHLYTATGFAELTLVLSLHAFPWDFVEGWFGPAVGKVVGMFQFPYRFLSLGTLLLCAAALFALQLLPERRAALAAAGLVCAALLTASITETNIMSAQGESSYATYNQNATINSVGTAEYLIDGASSYEAIWAQPKPTSGDLHLISYEKREGVAYVSVENDGGDSSVDLGIAGLGRIRIEGNAHAESVLTAGSGSFGSCIGSGSLGRRIGCGSLGRCGRSGLTAGSQRENHAKCKNKCKDLFHICLHIF